MTKACNVNEVFNEINKHTNVINDLMLTAQYIRMLEQGVNDKKFLKEDYVKQSEGLVENFILSSQSTDLEEKVSGELKNYLLGEYRKDKNPVPEAIDNFNSLMDEISKLTNEHMYMRLIHIGGAYKEGAVVMDKSYTVDESFTLSDIQVFYKNFYESKSVKKMLAKCESHLINPLFTKIDYNEGLYSFQVDFCEGRLKDYGMRSIDLIQLIKSNLEKLQPLDFNERELSFSEMYIDEQGVKIGNFGNKNFIESLSNKKVKKLQRRFTLKEPEVA